MYNLSGKQISPQGGPLALAAAGSHGPTKSIDMQIWGYLTTGTNTVEKMGRDANIKASFKSEIDGFGLSMRVSGRLPLAHLCATGRM